MEHWQLDHPERGTLEAYAGSADELRTVDPGFTPGAPDPGRDDDGTGASPVGDEGHGVKESSTGAPVITPAGASRARGSTRRRAGERLPLSPGRKEKLRTHLGLDDEWARPGLVLMRDGVVFARRRSIGNVKIRLVRSTPDGHFTEHTQATEKPRVEVSVNPVRGYVMDVQLRDDGGVTAFEAPVGSMAAHRYAATDSSPLKRVLYPILGGLGKSGWAVSVLVLGPLVARLLAWIFGPIIAWMASLVPDIDWPEIQWPSVSWPSVDLPSIPWPRLPSWTPPGWLAWLLEHPKVWVPIVAAAFWGVTANRNRRRSERKKAEWAKRHAYARLAADLHALHDSRTEEDQGAAESLRATRVSQD